MTATQAADLKQTLEKMFDRISKQESVGEHLIRLDKYSRDLPPETPAQLRHFLQRRSYAKALEYLNHGVVIDDPSRPECDDGPHP